MAFKDVMVKLRRALLCCEEEDKSKHSLKIGSPTDVRRMDISNAIPVIKADGRVYTPEKAPHDGIRLLSLQSHPPSQPPTSPPSVPPSREPSQSPLNATSANFPNNLPTPPCQKHEESSPPSSRMKSMWERTRRFSNACSSLGSHADYQMLSTTPSSNHRDVVISSDNNTTTSTTNNNNTKLSPMVADGKPGDRKFKIRDETIGSFALGFDFKERDGGFDTLRSVSKSSVIEEGFEFQDTVGGYTPTKSEARDLPVLGQKKVLITRAVSSDTDGEVEDQNQKPFVST